MSAPLQTPQDHLREWAANPNLIGFPKPAGLPNFSSNQFMNYEEFNAWKKSCLEETSRAGGVKWIP